MMKKRIFVIALFFSLPVFSTILWHQITGGFCVSKILIARELATSPRSTFGALPENFEAPWTYLGKGRQTYVFLSSDGKYVIKFFRIHLTSRGVASHFDALRGSSLRKEPKKLGDWIESTFLAIDASPKKSGIVYFQPYGAKPSPLPSLTLVDALGRSYLLDGRNTSFLIQKKATLFKEVLDQCIRDKNSEKLGQCIAQYLLLQKRLLENGVMNKDPCPFRNTGVSENGEVFDLDVGRYTKHFDQKEWKALFDRLRHSLNRYVKKHWASCDDDRVLDAILKDPSSSKEKQIDAKVS